MPKIKKQKTAHRQQSPDDNKIQGPPSWTPARIQADPTQYLQIPTALQKQTQFASAALLGLVEASSLSIRNEHPYPAVSQQQIIEKIESNCPHVLKSDAMVFRTLLGLADPDTLNLLCIGFSPLVSAVSWNKKLALLAAEKAPLSYLYLPLTFLAKCSNHEKELLASGFRQLLVEGDPTTIDDLFNRKSSLISKITWDRELALQVVPNTPTFYSYFPESLKTNNTTLALAVLRSFKAKDDEEEYGYHMTVEHITAEVQEFCSGLFSDKPTLKEIFGPQGAPNDDVIFTILRRFSDRIAWDQEFVDIACNRSPASYSFLPARFRKDGIDAQRVMFSLLHLDHNASAHIAAAIEESISAVPGFFADRDAVEQLFLGAESDNVVVQVVKSLSSKLPWDRELTRVAAGRCHNGVVCDEENVTDVEMDRIFNGNVTDDCICHIPLGMMVSYMVAEAVDVWPEFLNKCGCHLARSNSVVKEAFEFVGEILQSVTLAPNMTFWLEALVFRLKKQYFESTETFQTLLKCIHVTNNDTPLECLKGGDETSTALKRHIAEYLGALGSAKTSETKQDALKLVYCLITLPDEFQDDNLEPSSLREYQADHHSGEGAYCEWCCKALARMNTKYNPSDEENVEDSDEDWDED